MVNLKDLKFSSESRGTIPYIPIMSDKTEELFAHRCLFAFLITVKLWSNSVFFVCDILCNYMFSGY